MRLFITGPTGSGKTTLAIRAANQAALPLYSLDDIHWVRSPDGDTRRAPEERLALLLPLSRQGRWIMEGVQFKWADAALDDATHIVVVDLPRWRNTVRILRRFLGRRWSSGRNPRATWGALRQEMRWSADYYEHERALLFAKIDRYASKVIVVRHDRAWRATLANIVATATAEALPAGK